ncbi:orf03; similar to FGARATs [Ateline gammaherpesvirus 3]|uniref:Similar to FGARATs n=1 Tax=Ateline herpesvirus 3 TaxID=85618 RepID=Q9YTQ9_ATHV3|nr:orf03; similar to FGARATs [Ateline gammaherpesvirus 3]AAC95537.1 orf03; similar to FGARATs [Ateline gammaherpesvirus 3]
MLVLHFTSYEALLLPEEELATSALLQPGPLQVTSHNPVASVGYVVYVKPHNASFLEPVLGKFFRSVSPKTPFTSPAEQTLSFSYGPQLRSLQTTFSRELVDILKKLSMFTPQGPKNADIIERIECYRTITIICDINMPTKMHQRHLQKLLCVPYTGLTKFILPQDKSLNLQAPEAARALSTPISDPLWVMCNGLFTLPGYSDKYSIFRRGQLPKVFVEKNSRLGIVLDIDYWTPWSSTNILYEGLYNVEKGVVYTFGGFTQTPNLMGVLNMALHWRAPLFFACQTGHITSLAQMSDMPVTQAPQMKMLHAHLNLLKCSSMPTIQGFFRQVPSDLATILPQTKIYNGFVSTALRTPTVCAATEASLREKTYLFQLGNFYTYNRHYLTWQDSGKEIGSILLALSFFMDCVKTESGIIVGMSTSLPIESMKAKLAAVCQHVSGARLLLSALPMQVTSKLAPFSNSTKTHNKEVLKQHFFNLTTSDLIIAIKNINLNAEEALKTACDMAGCKFKKIGWLVHRKGTTVVDDRGDKPYPKLQFDRFKPKFPLLKSPINITLQGGNINWSELDLRDTIFKILEHPSVGCKEFIVSHIDKLVSGRVARTAIVGPWQLPVSDYSIIVPVLQGNNRDMGENPWDYETDIDRFCVFEELAKPGICSSIGESTLIAQADLKIGTMRAITEALLNLAMASWNNIGSIIIQVAITLPYTAQAATSLQVVMDTAKTFCEALSVSCTFTASATDGGASIVASAIVNTFNVAKCMTPNLKHNDSFLLLLPTEKRYNHFGSVVQQICGKTFIGDLPQATSPTELKKLLQVICTLREDQSLVSGHDVSDGGLLAALVEMAISGGQGVRVYVPQGEDTLQFLSSETPGIVIEVPSTKLYYVQGVLNLRNVDFQLVGKCISEPLFAVSQNSIDIMSEPLDSLRQIWRKFSDACEADQVHPQPVEMHITTIPKFCPAGVCRFHSVYVYLLPHNSVPHGLLSAIAEAGFQPKLISIDHPYQTNSIYDPYTAWGFFIVGASNMQEENIGIKALKAQLKSHVALQRDFRIMLAKPEVFCVAIGAMACELLFYHKTIGYNKPSDTYMTCVKNNSEKFESRWSNIYIPENTKAIAFQSLKNSLLPCWTQGTHLRFYHPKPMLEKMAEHGMVSSMFYGHNLASGPAQHYPLTPNGSNATAGICSADGRHLALLHDPSLCNNICQWPYVPPTDPPLKVSPWKTMFLDLHKWGITVQGASPPPSRTDDPLRSLVF